MVCCDCKKKFFSDHELQLHMKVHSKEQTYFCSVCGEGQYKDI